MPIAALPILGGNTVNIQEDRENRTENYQLVGPPQDPACAATDGHLTSKQDESIRLFADPPKIGEVTKLTTTPSALAEARTFLPRLAEHYLSEQQFPMSREIAILFVDIADSTSAVLQQPPEVALALVQRFMGLVTEVALAHCGDVKDYEGDGALLYFGSVEQATRAALAIRKALAAREEGGFPLQARLSVNVGNVIIGVIGAPLRRSIALIGPAVSLASRLLKHIPPGGIIAPQIAVEKLRAEAPDLAERFAVWGECLILRGFEAECVTAYHLAPDVEADNPLLCNEQIPAWSSRCNRVGSVFDMGR